VLDIAEIPLVDKKLIELRTDWKGFRGRVESILADARETAEKIKLARRDYLVGKGGGKSDHDSGQERLRGTIGLGLARLRELLAKAEALRAEGFALGKQLRRIEADKIDEERRLRTTLYEKTVAGNLAEAVSGSAVAAPTEIQRLLAM
jgi:hypothetical protein